MGTKVKGINFKILKALAEDLNKVLDFEKPIPTKVGTKKDDLEKEIRKAAGQIEKRDESKFTKASEALFIEMGITTPWTGKEVADKGKGKTEKKVPATGKKKENKNITKTAFLASLIDKGDMKKKAVIDKVQDYFPGTSKASNASMISHGKKAKWKTFPNEIIDNSDGILSWGKEIA